MKVNFRVLFFYHSMVNLRYLVDMKNEIYICQRVKINWNKEEKKKVLNEKVVESLAIQPIVEQASI